MHPNYTEALLDHFRRPRNAGEIAAADAWARVESSGCGDVLQLTFRIEEDRISEVRFLCRGCVVAIASGSAVTGLLAGRTPAQALEMTEGDLERVLGSIPEHRRECAALACRAVHEALGGRYRP